MVFVSSAAVVRRAMSAMRSCGSLVSAKNLSMTASISARVAFGAHSGVRILTVSQEAKRDSSTNMEAR